MTATHPTGQSAALSTGAAALLQWQQWSGVLLGALVWLWPMTHGPYFPFWPNFVAWSAGLWLLVLLQPRLPTGAAVVAQGWLLAALVSAVLALVQYFGFSEWLFPLSATTPPGFAWANTRQINHLASLLVVGLWVLAWLQAQNRWLRHLPWMALLMASALAATASRGGALQLLMVAAMALAWGRGRRGPLLRLYGLALISYVLAMLILPWLLEHGLGVTPERHLLTRMAVEGTCSSRKVLWANVLELITQQPLTGWGWNGLRYGFYLTLFDGIRFCAMLTNAHNLPLQLATELGLPLAALFMLGTLTLLLWLRPWLARCHHVQLGWGVLAVVGLHSMLEYPLWFGNFQVMVLLALWLVWPQVRQRWAAGRVASLPEAEAGIARRTSLAVALALQLVLLGVGWDYLRVTQLFLPQAERLELWQQDPWHQIRRSVFFSDQILFAQVGVTDPSPDNAAALLDASLEALRISPEPTVIERVIVSAALLRRQDLVQFHALRYAANWPEAYAVWRAAQPADSLLPPVLATSAEAGAAGPKAQSRPMPAAAAR
jgi:O-antigen ligase